MMLKEEEVKEDQEDDDGKEDNEDNEDNQDNINDSDCALRMGISFINFLCEKMGTKLKHSENNSSELCFSFVFEEAYPRTSCIHRTYKFVCFEISNFFVFFIYK